MLLIMNIYEQKLKQLPSNAKKVFSGLLYDVFQWEQKMYDGTTATFEKLIRPDSLGILPVLDNGNIIVNYEEQPGRDLEVNMPLGRMESNENNPADAALRELREETGIIPQKLYFVEIKTPKGKVMQNTHYYISKGIKEKLKQNLDSGEKIESREMDLDKYFNLIKNLETEVPELFYKVLMNEGQDKLKRMILNPEEYFESVRLD